ncbi:MAG: GntR family transcriptional regulator [Vallitaleaceae bacterium]|nr:GntR family transcriptional regulator [Vallitaleaceae bacterium]
MEIQVDSKVPIYIQIAQFIEDLILENKLKEEEQAPSTNQLADYYKLNPATARKGLNILVDEQILYKKRGLGMYVSTGAVKMIKTKRKKMFVEQTIMNLIEECKKLDIGIDEVIEMILKVEGRRKG